MNDNYEGFVEYDVEYDDDIILNYDFSDLLFDDLLNLPTDINHPADQLLNNNNNNPTSSFIMPPTAAPALAGGVTVLNAAIGGDHQPQTYLHQSPIAKTHLGGGSRESPKRQYSTQYHSVLERKRRGNIREKIEYLHHMIPYSNNKTDIASMLDNVIQYTQTLRHQADVMMSICYNQVAVPGQPYIHIGPNSFDLGPNETIMNNCLPWVHRTVIVPPMFSPVAPFLLPLPQPPPPPPPPPPPQP